MAERFPEGEGDYDGGTNDQWDNHVDVAGRIHTGPDDARQERDCTADEEKSTYCEK